MSLLYPDYFAEMVESSTPKPHLDLPFGPSLYNKFLEVFVAGRLNVVLLNDANHAESETLPRICQGTVPPDQGQWPADGKIYVGGYKFLPCAWGFTQGRWATCEFIRADLLIDPEEARDDLYLKGLSFLKDFLNKSSICRDAMKNEGVILRLTEAQVHGKIINPNFFSKPEVKVEDLINAPANNDWDRAMLTRIAERSKDFLKVTNQSDVPYCEMKDERWSHDF